MSVTPDPLEPSAPAYGRARPPGVKAWLVAVFGLACVLAGYGLSRFGPHLLPAKPRPALSADLAAVRPLSSVQAYPAATPPDEASSPAPPDTAALSELATRLDVLEVEQSRTAQAAASALAAAALMEAAQSSRPFAEELAALDAVSPPSAELSALRRVAERGAPSRAALAASFPDHAARAAAAARAPGEGAGLMARLGAALSRVVTLRQVGDVPGSGVDALLARAERQVAEGDLDHALRTLESLPAGGREALAPWRAAAETRADIDRRISAVRVQALEDLARLARSGA
ncbi:MAG: mitofilin family membrane protein [Phenylobacterium sp.]|uniref:COG4223 family protein n=2 Tax=Phenylobacterium sp. TaxID=1871053 RepID=UPI002722C4FA|nr:mitofilin family membrane protein [Phenylobacterium sp.]MDO8913323.1 mitofilin family membrane protein [Phenylobacterium sp.]MDP2011057.1 mitofilin family membrane protein [Phenylobacterium sp.]MDP3634058.1 mitofilin family membrane protein [Phenylobacterium sp.]HQT52358.1 mitofilin family membrane protein [Phenylobacterium sp.]